jgi:LPPG:FO 2-phospho-L-lactate transferase
VKIVALCGGVGGSKLITGLHLEFPDDTLAVIVNTADDVILHGLNISPDLDTVMYTLAGSSNPNTGWGLEGDTFHGLEMMRTYGHDAWFKIGDRDMVTHLLRTAQLAAGGTLTSVTADLAQRLGVGRTILPMTNDRVVTRVRTRGGWLDFQDYFVRRGHTDRPLAVEHVGAAQASPTPQVLDAIAEAGIIVAAPSNPVVSIGPILTIPRMLDAIRDAPAPTVAVSPIIGSRSVTGPADALMQAVGFEPTVAGLAEMYKPWLDTLVVDSRDINRAGEIESLGLISKATDTLMPDVAAKRRLARFVVEAAR